ncbi:copper resistance CopC family protein [Corynebacterium timonense]|uniref:CopC domain-containing protein n=1 Tax=Corynebacterium timonense TaxID=441500 RepID=A0A1H1NJA7_9CORY|nr:copper resistance CopC family protein [Corynebacterium timonense]SDR98795.1 hypothetical protein SAMN04488539_0787 [Corynebacterium timonense]
MTNPTNRAHARTSTTQLTRRAAAAAAAAVGAVAAGWAPLAQAHDAVTDASPGDGEVVTEFPDELRLTFSGQIQEGYNTLALSNADTEDVIYTGDASRDGFDVTVDLPADLDPEPGNYRIGFQVISSDGHATRGMTTFVYQPEGSAPVAAASDPAGAETTDAETTDAGDEAEVTEDEVSSNNWQIVIAALGVLAIGGAAIAVLAKRRGPRDGGAAES